jgi:NTE family protein
MSTTDKTTVAIACQGGGSHTAFTAGALRGILRGLPDKYEIVALSGTSGGAMCAALAWDGLRRNDVEGAIGRLDGFWKDMAAKTPWDRFANAWSLWASRSTGQFGSFGASPYATPTSVAAQRQLRETIERHVGFDDPVPASPPHLFVGAVNVESGSFEVFADGEKGADALLASAAIPSLFRAVEIDGASHWDGLFSQNPPIRHFISEVPTEAKPDEIWIVRIDPIATGEVPRSLDDIADRRSDLSGNLSLEQEKHIIESINDMIEKGIITDEAYKRIAIREIDLGMKLDLLSKRDRDAAFLATLMERGESKASEFWTRDDEETEAEAALVA